MLEHVEPDALEEAGVERHPPLVGQLHLGRHDEVMRELEPYLDLFHLDRGVARSLVNCSEIRGGSDQAPLDRLDAVPLMQGGAWVAESQFESHEVLADANPAMSIAWEFPGIEDPARERFDVLVVTALCEEYEAAKSIFLPIDEDSASSSVARLSAGRDIAVRVVTAGGHGTTVVTVRCWVLADRSRENDATFDDTHPHRTACESAASARHVGS